MSHDGAPEMNPTTMHTIATLRQQELLRDAARHRATTEALAEREPRASRMGLIGRLWHSHGH